MPLKVCLAGATGWAGSELSRGIAADDLQLVSAVSRKHAGQRLEAVLVEGRLDTPIFGTAAEALARGCDVLVDYTSADAAKANVLAALDHGAHVVVGSSGLTDQDYAEIDAVARERQRGVLRQLRAHDGAAAEVRGAGREVPPELGDHRLRV